MGGFFFICQVALPEHLLQLVFLVLERVLQQGAPHVQLLHVDAVEIGQLGVRGLEESPLVALEIDGGHEWQNGARLETEGVDDLDPDIHVTVLLHPDAAFRVQNAARVVGGIEPPQNARRWLAHDGL